MDDKKITREYYNNLITDYIEGKNLIDKLHLDVIDGKDSKGVGKYDDLFDYSDGTNVIQDFLDGDTMTLNLI